MTVEFTYEPDMPWQKTFLEMINEKPDYRTIFWICDKVGNSGKTALSKYLYLKERGKWLICKDLGTSRDSATIIKNELENGWLSHGIIIDLPRSAEKQTRMYNYIEEVKDGFITSQKYQGGTCIFNSPHVVIMANWMPDTKCLSLDRWKIYKINEEKELIHHKVDFVYDEPDGLDHLRNSYMKMPEYE